LLKLIPKEDDDDEDETPEVPLFDLTVKENKV